MHYKKREKTLLQKEFELLIQDLKKSGLVINENVENIEPDKMLVTFISGKKRKKRDKHPSFHINVLSL